ncbi:MAG: Rrf2 family transcriptional regulator [Thermoanaerobaculales bacterium]|jgi:Rrf2 family protein|nr:Rrf2 family transcriptional regulator [Thermoanaerobaculales bacterium]
MISKTAEYALRAVVVLAGSGDDPVLAPRIAEATRVPLAYLSKVLQTLARADLVISQRGQGGGFSLARPAAEITVLDVVEAVDPIPTIERCPLSLEAHADRLCPLHHRLDEAIRSIRATFGGTSIGELVAGEGAVLCSVPQARSS